MEIDSDDTYDDYSIEFDDEEPSKNENKRKSEVSVKKTTRDSSKKKNTSHSDDAFDDYSIEFDDDEPVKNKDKEKSLSDASKNKNNSHSDDAFDDYSIEFDDDEEDAGDKRTKTTPDKKKTEKYIPKRKNKGYTTGLTCRICLKRCKKQSHDASEFAETYLKCTGFTIEKKQPATKICYPCMNELLKVENFIDKCSTTEEKLSKGFVPKEGCEEDEREAVQVSDNDDDTIVIRGEDGFSSDGSNFSDTIKKPQERKKRIKTGGRRKKEKPKEEEDVEKVPKKVGRPPLSPSKMKPKKGPKKPVGRPRGSFKTPRENGKPKKPMGRPKGVLNFKEGDEPLKYTTPENLSGEHPVKREDGSLTTEVERQICFICGKLVRHKQLPYHIWKHRKDEKNGKHEEKKTPHYCEFCDKFYKTEELKLNHMKRIHPGVVYGMPSSQSPEPEPRDDDNFEKEFRVPLKEEYPQIMSPYEHTNALNRMQKHIRR